jgi:hypothetical protein
VADIEGGWEIAPASKTRVAAVDIVAKAAAGRSGQSVKRRGLAKQSSTRRH